MKKAFAIALVVSIAPTTIARAEEIIGVVCSETGKPIAGAVVTLANIGTDTTTDSGVFRIHATAQAVGARVRVVIEKDKWALTSTYDTFTVPSHTDSNPVIFKMRPATVVTRTEHADKNSPVISVSALTAEPIGDFDVQYQVIDEPGLLRIEANVGYLKKLHKGGPIQPVSWSSGSPFLVEAPALDVKVVNNTKDTLFLQDATFEVERSTLDLSSIFLVHGVGHVEFLPIVNLGWGDLKTCTVRFDLASSSETPKNASVYKYFVDATAEVNRGQGVSIAEALEANGVDMELVRRRFVNGDYLGTGGILTHHAPAEQERLDRKAFGRFADADVHVTGTVDYVQQDGVSGSVQFVALVVLGNPLAGTPVPPSIEYNVRLQVEGSNYAVHVPVANALKHGDYDRFTFRIAADKASVHIFRLKLTYNDKRVFVSRRIRLRFFASKADERLLAHSETLRALSRRDEVDWSP